jgi:hypothetical protein
MLTDRRLCLVTMVARASYVDPASNEATRSHDHELSVEQRDAPRALGGELISHIMINLTEFRTDLQLISV